MLEGRTVGILFADGADAGELSDLQSGDVLAA